LQLHGFCDNILLFLRLLGWNFLLHEKYPCIKTNPLLQYTPLGIIPWIKGSKIQIKQIAFYHLFIFTWNLIKFPTCVQYFYIFSKFRQWIKKQTNGLMDELKERYCFHFHFWGKWNNGWTQGEQLCQQLLDRSGTMDEFGEIWLKEIGQWKFGKLVDRCRGSGIGDELYKGSVLANKVALWSLISYRKSNFFQFPKQSWTILDSGCNTVELLKTVENIEWIQGTPNLVVFDCGKWNKWSQWLESSMHGQRQENWLGRDELLKKFQIWRWLKNLCDIWF
jgi:hypothetical protein